MSRIARLVVKGEPVVYHVISRTALEGFVLGDEEKDYLVKLIKRLSQVYFVELLGFCVMGNHFHLLPRVHPGDRYSDEDIRRRFSVYHGENENRFLENEQIPTVRKKWSSLSEYVKEIKQDFSRYYNKLHCRRGFFWAERFKSVIVENGDTLINCLAYIDLNPVRAGIVDRPEKYRWCSLAYHVQTGNMDGFLSTDFGLRELRTKDQKTRLKYYRKFVYEKGGLSGLEKEREKGSEIGKFDRFRYRTRYFSDSGIIGSKIFVNRHYDKFRDHFFSKHEKKPRPIKGLVGIYSLKRLSGSS